MGRHESVSGTGDEPLNAFCVDLEEWFHVCGVQTPYSDPGTWDTAPSHVVKDTEVLMRLLDETGARATFMTVGWVAERHPELIRRLADAGHEIGCHSYFHRLVYTLEPDEFARDVARSAKILRDISGQAVRVFRAPGFSMKRECFWAYPILLANGIDTDTSIVPARRDHGGVEGFTRDPFLLRTEAGSCRCFPVSVMSIAGMTVPFSGGGYLRLLPQALIHAGYRQNHRAGRPGMCYIHPREINPTQPRLPLPRLKYFKYYVNLRATEEKLRRSLRAFRFATVSEVLDSVRAWPEYRLVDGDIVPAQPAARA
jgi:polysaccharide deacetylase family protein (PEP-CTERM system associated)